jgi:hypothetical protein
MLFSLKCGPTDVPKYYSHSKMHVQNIHILLKLYTIYGETWTWIKADMSRLMAAEMRLLRSTE